MCVLLILTHRGGISHREILLNYQLGQDCPPRGFPHSSAGKESACIAGDLGLIPGLGRFPGEGKGYPLQYSGLENSMDSIVHGVTKSWARLSDFHFHFPLRISKSLVVSHLTHNNTDELRIL